MDASRVEIEWGGVRLVLLADRAVHQPARATLYLSDLHLGKPEHFRSAGVPAPEDVTDRDLARLSTLVEATGAERVVVLGDLFHDRVRAGGETAERLRAWRRAHASLHVELVPGNHDRWAGGAWPEYGIDTLPAFAIDGGLTLLHDPADAPAGAHALCGHLHPAARIGGRGRPSLRAACFWLTDRALVLPAFGRFTGTKLVAPGPGDRVFLTGDGSIVDVSGAVRPLRALRA